MEDIEIVDSKIGKIFDSRGNPAIEATIFLNYASGTSSAPAGASTGKTEVIAYPENNIENSIDFYNSKSVDFSYCTSASGKHFVKFLYFYSPVSYLLFNRFA